MKTKIEDSSIKLKPDEEKLIVVKIVDKFNQFEEERLSQLNDIKSIRNAIYDATIPKINAWESKIQLPEIYELAQTLKSHLTQNLYSHPDAMFDVSGTTPETQALANKQKAMLVNTFEEMKIHEEIEKIIDSIIETGEATIFVGWCTKIKQYRKALPFLNKSDTSSNNFIIEEKVIYDNAKIKHIKAEDFVFDKTNVNNWDECAKIYRSYSSLDEIATDNANNYLTNEKLEELKGVMAKNNTENKTLTNNKIEILEFWGDIELSDGKILKNRIITIAGGREIIRFEENPFVINPFIHANILENPSTLRGISPLRVALILNNISSSILNKQLDALSLMINPPYLAPKGCFNGLQEVKPGKIIEYDSALMPTPPTQISFEKAMQGWDFLNYFKNTIESSTGIFKNMAGNLKCTPKTGQ